MIDYFEMSVVGAVNRSLEELFFRNKRRGNEMNKSLKHALWFFMAVNIIVYGFITVIDVGELISVILLRLFNISVLDGDWFWIFFVPYLMTYFYNLRWLNYVTFVFLVVIQICYIHKCREWKFKYAYKMPVKEKIIYIIIWIMIMIGFIQILCADIAAIITGRY